MYWNRSRKSFKLDNNYYFFFCSLQIRKTLEFSQFVSYFLSINTIIIGKHCRICNQGLFTKCKHRNTNLFKKNQCFQVYFRFRCGIGIFTPPRINVYTLHIRLCLFSCNLEVLPKSCFKNLWL